MAAAQGQLVAPASSATSSSMLSYWASIDLISVNAFVPLRRFVKGGEPPHFESVHGLGARLLRAEASRTSLRHAVGRLAGRTD
jgi:hypothetical protein